MARKRYQNGRVFLKGKKEEKWVGRYREDVVEVTGTTKRVRRSVILGTKRELPTKRLAERRLATILARINCLDYRPGRAATFGEFIERWETEVLTTQKPSSARAVRSHLRCYHHSRGWQTTSGRIWRRESATIYNSNAGEIHGQGCLPKDNLECHRNNLHDPRNCAELGLQLRTDRHEEAAPATARCRVRGAALHG